ncbi:MAG TPA: ABC transporter permease [Ignavibacteriaceae bacterium]|nr:ABC transporter permease [Ignavibacteriaceae bacterium]
MNEIFRMSLESLRVNKLRTILTMLGVVVGIFSIIVIMTVITMLQSSIENGVSQLSKNTFQIQKFPAMMNHGDWSKFQHREDITLDDYKRLNSLLTQAKYIGAEQWQFAIVVKYGSKETNPNIMLCGASTGALKTNNWTVSEGRDFRENDVTLSNNVALIGKDIVTKLFPNTDPVGKYIRIGGQPMQVIGILDQQPQLFGQTRDNYAIIPITTFQSIYGKYSNSINITVMSYTKEDYNEVIETAIGYMRTIRKVPPGAENDFDVFSNETIMTQINTMTDGVKIGALIVSLIAMIAAGVGIMNIMLVSVTERTKEIGIRKAIGARKINILFQFLTEAILLCFTGGVIGILIGVAIGNLAGGIINAQSAIPYNWVILGMAICLLTGIIFGTYPAYKAANLDPIEALRYE